MVTSYGSIPCKDNRVEGDSIQVARLKAAGAIVVGKTNVSEFGFTGFTKNRLHGITRNPWNPEKTPGGSSGGGHYRRFSAPVYRLRCRGGHPDSSLLFGLLRTQTVFWPNSGRAGILCE